MIASNWELFNLTTYCSSSDSSSKPTSFNIRHRHLIFPKVSRLKLHNVTTSPRWELLTWCQKKCRGTWALHASKNVKDAEGHVPKKYRLCSCVVSFFTHLDSTQFTQVNYEKSLTPGFKVSGEWLALQKTRRFAWGDGPSPRMLTGGRSWLSLTHCPAILRVVLPLSGSTTSSTPRRQDSEVALDPVLLC